MCLLDGFVNLGRTITYNLDPENVTTLLELFCGRGADVNAANASGETPLFKVRQYLFQANVNLQAIYNTSVRYILISKLLGKQADPLKVTLHGDMILHYAARLGRHDLVELILLYTPDVTVRGAEGKTALEIAQQARLDNPEQSNAHNTTVAVLKEAEGMRSFGVYS